MPCRECGESAHDTSNGVVVGLSKDEDGTHRYWCLSCACAVLEILSGIEPAGGDDE